jgi:Condensation domain
MSRVPVSFGQQWLFKVAAAYPTCSAYNVPVCLRLTGDLDVGQLRSAIAGGIANHSALRTTFHSDGPSGEFGIVHDCPDPETLIGSGVLRGKTERSRIVEAAEAIAYENATPFNLSERLPVKGAIFQLDTRDHIVSLVFHHIACDARSMQLFVDEMLSSYAARTSPPAGPQYHEYAAAEHEELLSGGLDQTIRYWQRFCDQFRGVHANGGWGTSDDAAFAAQSAEVRLGGDTTGSMIRVGLRASATLLMVLQSSLAVTLALEFGQRVVLMATAVGNRENARFQSTAGSFAHHVPIAVEVNSGASFVDILRQTRDASTQAFREHRVPLENSSTCSAYAQQAQHDRGRGFTWACSNPAHRLRSGQTWDWTSIPSTSLPTNRNRSGT